MAEITSTVVVDLDARILWGALRIAGGQDGPLAIVTIRPARAAGFVVVEAVSEDRTLGLSLEVENPAELPRPIGIYSDDLRRLKRTNAKVEPRRIQIQTVDGANDDNGPVLNLRPTTGTNLLVYEAAPLDPLPLAASPSPWWQPAEPLPAPLLLNLERLRRLLAAVDECGLGPNVEVIPCLDHQSVGLAVRPWADDPLAWGSLQIARLQPVPRTGLL